MTRRELLIAQAEAAAERWEIEEFNRFAEACNEWTRKRNEGIQDLRLKRKVERLGRGLFCRKGD